MFFFLFFFTELKTTLFIYWAQNLPLLFMKHDTTDIADPSSMQDMCHM